jgi:hypothetical protein
MGYRDGTGWHVVAQKTYTTTLKSDTYYDMLVAVNGTTVTVQVGGKQYFVYTYAARVIDDETYGLNKGMVGAGSSNAKGVWDNFKVQVLPPALTFDETESFDDGVADRFTGVAYGSVWTATAGVYTGTAPTGITSFQTVDLGVGSLDPISYLEIQATVKTNGIGGIIFDENSATHYKYVALDIASQRVLIGHYEPSKGWVVDTSVSKALVANTNYVVVLTMKGASVSVTVGGSFIASWGYNAPVVDGAVGVLTRSGTTSFDSFRIRTNDEAFMATAPTQVAAEPNNADATQALSLTSDELTTIGEEAINRWATTLDAMQLDLLKNVRFFIADLPNEVLGQAAGQTVNIDKDAAGNGWFIDSTPGDDGEFLDGTSPQGMDLLTVVMHEMGHVLGYTDTTNDPGNVMNSTLDAGVRLTFENTNGGRSTGNGTEKDLSGSTAVGKSNDAVNLDGYVALNRLYEQNAKNNWFANYIEKDVDPNKGIKIGL